jgi:hypothetical protein
MSLVLALLALLASNSFEQSAVESMQRALPHLSDLRFVRTCMPEYKPSVYAVYRNNRDEPTFVHAEIPWRLTSFYVQEVSELPDVCAEL